MNELNSPALDILEHEVVPNTLQLATCPRINKTTWHQPSQATIKLSWIREKSR
jgi:hypothetical protein